MLPGWSSPREARPLAEKMRAALEQSEWPCGRLTASIGGASAKPIDGLSAAQLLARADRALYEAKRNGRNQVSYFENWSDGDASNG